MCVFACLCLYVCVFMYIPNITPSLAFFNINFLVIVFITYLLHLFSPKAGHQLVPVCFLQERALTNVVPRHETAF